MPMFSVFCHLSCHLVSWHILFHQVSPSQLWSASISLVALSLSHLCTCPSWNLKDILFLLNCSYKYYNFLRSSLNHSFPVKTKGQEYKVISSMDFCLKLAICAQKWRSFVCSSVLSLTFVWSWVCVLLYTIVLGPGKCGLDSTTLPALINDHLTWCRYWVGPEASKTGSVYW